MLLRAIDGRFTGFQGGTLVDHGNESLAVKRVLGLSMKFPRESQKGAAAGVNPVPELLSPGPRCSLCQAPELCVSGPALSVSGPGAAPELFVPGPALAVSGPGALCVVPPALSRSVSGPARSLCQGCVSGRALFVGP